jgi:hypothetical protein
MRETPHDRHHDRKRRRPLFAAIIVAGIVFERINYRGNASTPFDANWRPTNERFLDEANGRPITAWFNAATGERRHVGDRPLLHLRMNCSNGC